MLIHARAILCGLSTRMHCTPYANYILYMFNCTHTWALEHSLYKARLTSYIATNGLHACTLAINQPHHSVIENSQPQQNMHQAQFSNPAANRKINRHRARRKNQYGGYRIGLAHSSIFDVETGYVHDAVHTRIHWKTPRTHTHTRARWMQFTAPVKWCKCEKSKLKSDADNGAYSQRDNTKQG